MHNSYRYSSLCSISCKKKKKKIPPRRVKKSWAKLFGVASCGGRGGKYAESLINFCTGVGARLFAVITLVESHNDFYGITLIAFSFFWKKRISLIHDIIFLPFFTRWNSKRRVSPHSTVGNFSPHFFFFIYLFERDIMWIHSPFIGSLLTENADHWDEKIGDKKNEIENIKGGFMSLPPPISTRSTS